MAFTVARGVKTEGNQRQFFQALEIIWESSPSHFSQKTLIPKFFHRAGSRFSIIGDLMPKGDSQAEIGTGRPSGLIKDIFVMAVRHGVENLIRRGNIFYRRPRIPAADVHFDRVSQPNLCGGLSKEFGEGFSGFAVSGRNTAELLETIAYPLDELVPPRAQIAG